MCTCDFLSDTTEALLDLASAPQRWPTKSEGMSTLCPKILRVIRVICKWSRDADPNHRDRRLWSIAAVNKTQGEEGFARLVCFGLDSDYAFLCHKLVQIQDPTFRDVSLADHECAQYLEITKALFEEGRIFEESCGVGNPARREEKASILFW